MLQSARRLTVSVVSEGPWETAECDQEPLVRGVLAPSFAVDAPVDWGRRFGAILISSWHRDADLMFAQRASTGGDRPAVLQISVAGGRAHDEITVSFPERLVIGPVGVSRIDSVAPALLALAREILPPRAVADLLRGGPASEVGPDSSGSALPAWGLDRLPKPLVRVPPSYPDLARESGVSGMVMVEAFVGTSGLVEEARIIASTPLLDCAALRAVQQWRFAPATAASEPVRCCVWVPVRFSLH
jgi:protein TonB